MNDIPDPEAEYVRPAHDVRKIRNCLRCQEKFESEWFGERICSRCKKTHSWKRGIPLGDHGSGRNR